jgi:hypothetical protein
MTNIITVSGLKQFLDGKIDSQHDKILSSIVSGVSELIESHTNRFLEKSAYTYYFEANGRRCKYWLPAYPVDLDESFKVTVNDEEYTIDEDYFVRENNGLLEFYLAPVRVYPKGIKVEWTGGYELVDDSSDDDGTIAVPGKMKLAAYMQASFMFRRRNDIGISVVSMPDGMIKKAVKADDLLPEVKKMLRNMRRDPGEF